MRTCWKWWLRQFAELLPGGAARLTSTSPDATIFDLVRDDVSLLIRQRQQSRVIETVHADSAGLTQLASTLAVRRDLPRTQLLRVPLALALRKEITLPLAAEGDLDTLLGFEMDRETPFAKDEVYWGYRLRHRDVQRGRLELDLLIIPQGVVAALLDQARAAGLAPSGVEVELDRGAPMLVPLGGEAPRWTWRPDRTTAALAALAATLLLVALAGPFIRQRMALAAADRAVASLTAEAEEASALRKSIDQINETATFLANQRVRGGDALSVLAALTRILPDDTHLTTLSLRDGKLTISGLSPQAASLIALLAKTAPFHEPAFASPVLENQDQGLEAFTIAVSLDAAGGT